VGISDTESGFDLRSTGWDSLRESTYKVGPDSFLQKKVGPFN
jgi:hypothetical protein